MGFNYGLEKKHFDANWDRLRREYIAAGMREADIENMLAFDWEIFKRERIFQNHNQPIENMPLSAPPEESRNWVDALDTPELIERVKTLSQKDLALVSRLVADGVSRADLARELGVSRAAITKRIARIKKVLDLRLTK